MGASPRATTTGDDDDADRDDDDADRDDDDADRDDDDADADADDALWKSDAALWTSDAALWTSDAALRTSLLRKRIGPSREGHAGPHDLVDAMRFGVLPSLLALAAALTAVSAHTVISYPGSRGNNLLQGNATFPYDLQWQYPCGGLGITTNRTKWPITGGAIALQPGWFPGHLTAFFYINMGFQTEGPGSEPLNMSNPMVPVFQITGPTKDPYPGTFCLPQVPLPANTTFKVGDNATIQVVETAVHGAALYNCVDITFAEPEDVEPVTKQNCFNDSAIGFNKVFATTSTSDAPSWTATGRRWALAAPMLAALAMALS
ncbi:MAG: hypothetical protein M1832_000482 [Thelocarpon impressellum]|nr:MAG: hypothetical protein M1832_000482 [Thelocarpon impressellum]